jgi:hypothetical protein
LTIIDDKKVVGIVSRFDFSGIELDRFEEEPDSGNGSEQTRQPLQ